ncbi:MAG: hypothetical protein Tsb0020_25640 [Haliangiales bacterium]
MATRILGIDLGTYSVKVLVAQPGFRQSTPIGFFERRLPPPSEADGDTGGTGHVARAITAISELAREHGLGGGDTVFAGVDSGELFIHVLDFGFKSLRRPDLEKAVGAELEGILPIDLEDMVYGFEGLPESSAADTMRVGDVSDEEPTAVRGTVGTSRPGRVAAPTEGMRVLACAMETARARYLIDALDERGLEPRGLIAVPAAYARIAEAVEACDAASAHPPGGHAIVDIGHERTSVCVVQAGRAVFARSMARGGRHVSAAIASAWQMPFADAESAKHTLGFVASVAQPAQNQDQQRMHRAIEAEVGALGWDLKRSLQSCVAKTGVSVTRVTLIGGGSRLVGLAGALSERLRLPVQRLTEPHARALIGDPLVAGQVPIDIASTAAGLMLESGSGRLHFDLRQGELAYRADLSFLRERVGAIATALVVVIAFATFNGFAALYQLRAAEAALKTRLALETTALFGEQLDSAQTMARIGGSDGAKESPLPDMSAYDIMLEISDKLPGRDQVTLDIQNLDIRATKVTFQATTKSSPEIDTIEEALGGIECFKDISRGSTSTGVGDVRQFSFSITTNCM